MHPIIEMLGSKEPNDPLHLKGKKFRRVLASTLTIGLLTLNLYHVSREIEPGQFAYNTLVERVSRDHSGVVDRDILAVSTVVFLTSGSAWTVPANFGSLVSVECIAGGGLGPAGDTVTNGGGGGGGGAYAKITSTTTTLTPGVTSITYGLGAGLDTFWNATSLANAVTNGSAKSCAAQKGTAGVTAGGTPAAAGGLAGSSVGTTKFSGGAGGADGLGTTNGGGGGGAAGPSGAGGNASTLNDGVGGTGNNGNRAANTAGSASTDCATAVAGGSTQPNLSQGGAGVAGKTYGGGAAGAGTNNSTGAAGSTGIIVIIYNPAKSQQPFRRYTRFFTRRF
jgi:hypothetical protein